MELEGTRYAIFIGQADRAVGLTQLFKSQRFPLRSHSDELEPIDIYGMPRDSTAMPLAMSNVKSLCIYSAVAIVLGISVVTGLSERPISLLPINTTCPPYPLTKTSPVHHKTPRPAMSTKLQNAKNLYLEGIRDGNYAEAVEQYTGDKYIQHSTGVRDGKEGFKEFFSDFIERNPKREIDIVRGWEDNGKVFLMAYQNINDGESEWVTTDFFDYDENDKIIEHWDVISKFNPSNPAGRSSVDGPTEITDLDKTEENKALVTAMLKDILFEGGDVSKIGDYIAEEYLQHNPMVGDGLEHFRKLANAEDRPLWYDEIVLILGSGNFVATLCKARFEDKNYAQVDVFRCEDGKIVEHWDNVEPVPEESVNGGKF